MEPTHPALGTRAGSNSRFNGVVDGRHGGLNLRWNGPDSARRQIPALQDRGRSTGHLIVSALSARRRRWAPIAGDAWGGVAKCDVFPGPRQPDTCCLSGTRVLRLYVIQRRFCLYTPAKVLARHRLKSIGKNQGCLVTAYLIQAMQ